MDSALSISRGEEQKLRARKKFFCLWAYLIYSLSAVALVQGALLSSLIITKSTILIPDVCIFGLGILVHLK